jgi:xanthine dehydrogenase YagS FAD-binding subunit
VRQFEYASAATRQQVPELLGAQGDAAILAGGTDLLALMKDDVVTPKRLVNIKEVRELRGITAGAQGLRLGALATLDEIATNATVRKSHPMLAEACAEAASPQIRNMATIGGNVCQRPRCWYFRNGMGLLAMRDGKSMVLAGDNRYHAILGNDGPAYFVSPSTVVPVLIAYGAKLRIQGPSGAREVAAEKFYLVPKNENEREHDLRANELVTEIIVPPAPAGAKSANYEVRQKEAFDWPLATASVLLQMSGNTVQSARVVLGNVAPVPWPSPEAEQALAGKQVTPETAMAAANAALAKAKSLGKNKYKITVAKAAVKRAILQAAGINPIQGGA